MSVYFIQAGENGPIKIGHAKNALVRFKELQVASHQTLTLLGLVDGGANEERAFHEKFAAHRVRGEWFAPVAELVNFAHANKPPVNYRRSVLERNGHPLALYLARKRLTLTEYGKLVDAAPATLSRVINRVDGPSWKLMQRIEEESGGELTPNDFRWPFNLRHRAEVA